MNKLFGGKDRRIIKNNKNENKEISRSYGLAGADSPKRSNSKFSPGVAETVHVVVNRYVVNRNFDC